MLARDPRRETGAYGAADRRLDLVQLVRGEPPEEPFLVLVRTRPHEDALQYTHAFVSAFTRARYRSALAERLSLAAYELFGNALSYSSMVAEVTFGITEVKGTVSVRVSNETVPIRVEMLSAHLELIRENAEAAFLEGMRRSAMGGVALPMLGLARLVHEAKLSLDAYVRLGQVTIVARAAL